MKIVTDLSVTSAPHRARHGWHPGWLFRSGALGVWFDPSDLTTLYQDAAGMIPVTGVNQPVGRMEDKSGNGFHATQTVGAARPVLRADSAGRRYLDFDGVDDRLVVPLLDLTATTRLTLVAGARKISGGAARVVLGHAASSGLPGGFDMLTATGANQLTAILGRSTAGSSGQAGCFVHMPAPASFQITAMFDYAAPPGEEFLMRISGTEFPQIMGPTQDNTGGLGSGPLYIGARANNTLFHAGWIYGICLVADTIAANSLARTEAHYIQMVGGL